MKKIILSVMVSLDGYIEGEQHNIEWHVWNSDMDDYMSKFLTGIDKIILGRYAYEIMAGYWPTSAAESENPLIAHKMNKLNKLVYSRTLTHTSWRNSEVIRELKKEDVLKLKNEGEKDMVIFGGAEIIQSFMDHDLIDEFRMIINPVILGKGKRLFREQDERLKQFGLVQAIPNNSGNVILCYAPLDT